MVHQAGYGPIPRTVEYLTWDECREMSAAGMTIGSHTNTHARLSELTEDQVVEELSQSKARITMELRAECRHFACPWGRPGRDFIPGRDVRIARELGYESFSTTVRGAMRAGDSPYSVRRDHIAARWGTYQLQYFLSVDLAARARG